MCRGIDNLSAYGFGCPPCVGQRLAEECAEYVMTVALRDDVITRFSPQALERLQKELRDLDLEAAKQVLTEARSHCSVQTVLLSKLSCPVICSR